MGGKFRLYGRSEIDADWDPSSDPRLAVWDPESDRRLTAWQALQYLVALLERSESQATMLMSRIDKFGDNAHQLAYLLHKIASDNEWADEAFAYNDLITVWQTLRRIPTGVQLEM